MALDRKRSHGAASRSGSPARLPRRRIALDETSRYSDGAAHQSFGGLDEDRLLRPRPGRSPRRAAHRGGGPWKPIASIGWSKWRRRLARGAWRLACSAACSAGSSAPEPGKTPPRTKRNRNPTCAAIRSMPPRVRRPVVARDASRPPAISVGSTRAWRRMNRLPAWRRPKAPTSACASRAAHRARIFLAAANRKRAARATSVAAVAATTANFGAFPAAATRKPRKRRREPLAATGNPPCLNIHNGSSPPPVRQLAGQRA